MNSIESIERGMRSSRASRRGEHAWRVFAVAGVLAALCVDLLPVGLARDVVYVLVGAAGVAAILVGVRLNRPSAARAWYLFAFGCGLWVAGDAVFVAYDLMGAVAPYPSVVDALYLAAYPLLAGALVMLERDFGDGRSVTGLIDGVIFVICLGLMSWVFLVSPTWAAGASTLLGRVVAVAYPLGDLLLLGVVIGLATARGNGTGPTRMLAGAFTLMVVADTLYGVSQFVPVVAVAAPALDAGWLIAYVLFGVASLHPSTKAPPHPRGRLDTSMPRGRLGLLMVACLAMPGVIIVQLIAGKSLSIWPVMVIALPLIVLTFVRIGRTVGQVQRQATQFAQLADTDDVTGLANRRQLYHRLDAILAVPHPSTVLMLLDFERFTAINDALGYRTGDALLCAVARRVVDLAGAGAVVARVGGATFAVMDTTTEPVKDDVAAAGRFREALEVPYQLPDLLVVSMEVAVGVVRIPAEPGTPGATVPTASPTASPTAALVLGHAGVALGAAKTTPGRAARYAAELGAGADPTTKLLRELSAALERDEVVLYYQPQTELATGRVVGVEALARWQHPTRGLLFPDLFIPAVEQSALIGPFTNYVLNRALAQGARWREHGLALTIAVNLSARNLLDPDLVTNVGAALARHSCPPEALELEITESSAMIDPRRAVQVLSNLHRMGIRLAVDDYGTGHSSLSYLGRLPVRTLKIDRSFVIGMTDDRVSGAIVRSTIELARQLNLTVIAEGAEDDDTVLALRGLGCYAVQGYAVARPVPSDLIPATIESIHERIPHLLGMPPLTNARPGAAAVWGYTVNLVP